MGLSIGLALAWAAAGMLRTVLYKVDPRDPMVLAVLILGFAGAGLLASFLPARRVTTIDPVVALIAE